MSAHLQPADLGLGYCAACDHELRDGEQHHRGLVAAPAGMLLYVTCAACAERILHDTDAAERFADSLRETLQKAVLEAMPAEGSA